MHHQSTIRRWCTPQLHSLGAAASWGFAPPPQGLRGAAPRPRMASRRHRSPASAAGRASPLWPHPATHPARVGHSGQKSACAACLGGGSAHLRVITEYWYHRSCSMSHVSRGATSAMHKFARHCIMMAKAHLLIVGIPQVVQLGAPVVAADDCLVPIIIRLMP